MYHICPPRCQTQFVRAEDANRWNEHFRRRIPRNLPSSLRQPSVSRLTGMDERQNAALGDRLLDSGGAENHLSGLVGQRQERRALRSASSRSILSASPSGALASALSARRKNLPFDGLRNAVMGGSHPHAAARQLLLEVRNDRSVGVQARSASGRPWGGAGARQSAAAERLRRIVTCYRSAASCRKIYSPARSHAAPAPSDGCRPRRHLPPPASSASRSLRRARASASSIQPAFTRASRISSSTRPG